ncbi:uncharacterized protein LOC133361781 [Lethenteron reissneri]|uniref:uncharacterized protein LOC133361781 n=1 Tax=Lethenteron reissneri TaxID=7753 RepID=UPI002AB65789|nr:uncharacterized protein LOC133361781 [Lethenteron reissneri]
MALGAGRPVTAATGAEPEKLKRDRRRRGGQASVGNGGDRGVANDNGNRRRRRRRGADSLPHLPVPGGLLRGAAQPPHAGGERLLLGPPVQRRGGRGAARQAGGHLPGARQPPRAHFFSLSAVTERGPTSVRVHFRAGAFALDTVQEAVHAAPRFASLMELIEHYMGESRRLDRAGGGGGGDDDGGDRRHRRRDGARYCVTHDDGTRLPLLLSRPLPRHAGAPPSMQHACRRAIHRAVPGERLAELPLPAPLGTSSRATRRRCEPADPRGRRGAGG